MAERRDAHQLELIKEFASLAAGAGVECWLRGGWALDFLLGRITRPHQDIDLFIWAADASILLDVLRRHGYEEVDGPPPAQQRNLVKAGEEFHVTLLERNELGVVTAGGRWADFPWPEDMLDGPVGQIHDVRCRVISPEAQRWAKEDAPKALGHPQRDRDPEDLELLRRTIADQGPPSGTRRLRAWRSALRSRLTGTPAGAMPLRDERPRDAGTP